MEKILDSIQTELKKHIDKKYQQDSLNFFKEEVKLFGVRNNIVRTIAQKYFVKIKALKKKEIFSLCEQLLKTNYNENATIALAWADKLKKQYSPDDFKTFENWLKKYIINWGMCDDFCTHAFANLVAKFPELIPKVKLWTKAKNRWVRRASAVIFVSLTRQTNCLKDIFHIANTLLTDKDDLIQKGYGWMLKEASRKHQQDVFDFVMKNKHKMPPRTALRYAIEKMPTDWKKKAMLRQK